jgi:hypothetical protein
MPNEVHQAIRKADLGIPPYRVAPAKEQGGASMCHGNR